MFLLVTVYWLRDEDEESLLVDEANEAYFPAFHCLLIRMDNGHYMECVVDMKICVEVMFLVTIICRHNYQISWRVLLTASIQTTIRMISIDLQDKRWSVVCCPANRQHQNPVDLVDWDIQDVWLNQVFAAAVFIRSCLPKPFGSVYKILSELQNFLLSPGYQGDEINWWQDEVIR